MLSKAQLSDLVSPLVSMGAKEERRRLRLKDGKTNNSNSGNSGNRDNSGNSNNNNNTNADVTQLGAGGFGAVFKVGDYVVKQIDLVSLSDLEVFKREVGIWTEFSANPEMKPFIPEFVGSLVKPSGRGPMPTNMGSSHSAIKRAQAWMSDSRPEQYGFIVQKYEPVSTLASAIEGMEDRTDGARYGFDYGYGIFNNLVRGFEILHRLGYVHRDIKPHNILLRIGEGPNKTMPLIIDFGLVCKAPCAMETSACTDDPENSPAGTTYYLPNNAVPFSERIQGKARQFPVSRNKTTFLNRFKKVMGCAGRTRKVNKIISVKTHDLKAKGFYSSATDNYALALTLQDLFNFIDWSKNPKEKAAAQDLIRLYRGQVIPTLAANIGKKVAARKEKAAWNADWEKADALADP